MRLVVSLFMLSALGGIAPIAVGSTKEDLLKAVQATRAAVFRAEPSGFGEAEAKGLQSKAARTNDPLSNDNGTMSVKFWFSNGDCVYKEYRPKDQSQAIYEARVSLSGSKMLEFYAGNHAASAVIRTINYKTGISPAPQSWSLEELARVPYLFRNDAEYFDFVQSAEKPGYSWTATKNGLEVTLVVAHNWASDRNKEKFSERLAVTFDMAHRAMISLCQYEMHEEPPAGTHTSMTQRMQMTWSNSGNFVVPVERRVELNYPAQPSLKKGPQHWVSDVKFVHFNIGPVGRAKLSITALGIPDGTPVTDYISGRTWKYDKASPEPPRGYPAEDSPDPHQQD